MVDTINPQTGSADTFRQDVTGSNVGAQAAGTVFSGFSKPDDVKVNLAAKEETGASANFSGVSSSNIEATLNPTMENAPRVDIGSPQVATDSHVSYASSKSSINFKAIGFMVAVGLISIAVFGFGAYFISHSIYNSKLSDLDDKLQTAKNSLSSEQAAPVALELPQKTEAPASTQPVEEKEETPVVEEKPATTVEQKPVETTEPTSPSVDDQGMG